MTQQHSDSEGNKTIAIPISTGNAVTDVENNDGGDDGTVEEWAMLELNGELLLPTVVAAQNSGAKENESCKVLGRDGMELGSLQFRDKVSDSSGFVAPFFNTCSQNLALSLFSRYRKLPFSLSEVMNSRDLFKLFRSRLAFCKKYKRQTIILLPIMQVLEYPTASWEL